jgi:catechol 2,3-dioxygenase-like lactoylglutathione lyase family enzyme
MREGSTNRVKLSNGAIVFVTPDVEDTSAYYRDVLGFRVVEHLDKPEPFATLYRDAVEIIVVQAKHGEVVSNQERYGAGYDAYLDPQNVGDVDRIFEELQQRAAVIVSPPALTAYGSYEFVIEDIDGRRIGIGRVRDKEVFFGEEIS